ncbi:MAG: polysaccharide deacetylase family protein, partial [Pyrinomonadaceae bacterium]
TDAFVYLPNTLREKAIREIECELGDKLDGYPRGYRLLDWDMIREMSRKGINFGSHTANHVVLPLENEATISSEITRSKTTLENEIGKRSVSFAYPNGEYTDAIRNLTAKIGFGVAVTTENRINRPGADLFTLGRTSLCEESTRGVGGNYAPAVANLRLGI